MINDFSEDADIEFLENDEGELVITPTLLDDIDIYISDQNDNPLDDIDEDEIYVAIITEEQG